MCLFLGIVGLSDPTFRGFLDKCLPDWAMTQSARLKACHVAPVVGKSVLCMNQCQLAWKDVYLLYHLLLTARRRLFAILIAPPRPGSVVTS